MTSSWGRRWMISVGLTGALALALLLRGDTILGAFVGMLAIARGVLFLRLHYRRDRYRQGHPLRHVSQSASHSVSQSVSRLTESPGSR